MPQKSEPDVSRKYEAELRSDGRRHGQCRTLNDAPDDHLDDGSSRLGAANRAKRLKRGGLFRHSGVNAIARETIAESCERGHGGA